MDALTARFHIKGRRVAVAGSDPAAEHRADLLESAGGVTSPPFPVERFALFESQLTPEGAVYSIVERYALS